MKLKPTRFVILFVLISGLVIHNSPTIVSIGNVDLVNDNVDQTGINVTMGNYSVEETQSTTAKYAKDNTSYSLNSVYKVSTTLNVTLSLDTGESATDISYSPSGDMFAVTHFSYTVVYNSSSLQELANITNTIGQGTFSGHGHFATTVQSDRVDIYNTTTWNLITSYSHDYSSAGTIVNAVAFSHGGEMLASADDANYLEVRDTTDWSIIHGGFDLNHDGFALEFSPGNSLLAAGNRDGEGQIFNTTDWTLIQTISPTGSWIRSVAFSASGSYLALASSNDGVYVYNTSDWQLDKTYASTQISSDTTTKPVDFSRQGGLLVNAAYKDFQVQDLNSSQTHQTISDADFNYISAAQFSPNSTHLVVGDVDGTVKVFNFTRNLAFKSSPSNLIMDMYGSRKVQLNDLTSLKNEGFRLSVSIDGKFYEQGSNITLVSDSYSFTLPELKLDGYDLDFVFNNSVSTYNISLNWYMVDTRVPNLVPNQYQITPELGNNYTISWNVSDSYPKTYKFSVNSSVVETGTYENGSIEFEFRADDLKYLEVNLQVFDIYQNNASHVVSVLVQDTTSPLITDNSNSELERDNSTTLSWNISDQSHGSYKLYRNDTVVSDL